MIFVKIKLDVTIIDGAKKHYYQPIWTLVGGGLYDFEKSKRGVLLIALLMIILESLLFINIYRNSASHFSARDSLVSTYVKF